MRSTIYKLHFTSPLHIGTVREDYGTSLTTISSDTMYAALTACLAKLGETIPENGDLGCAVSSLFPFYQADENAAPIFFLPRPMVANQPAQSKELKKVAWLSVAAFADVLQGRQPFDDARYAVIGKYLLDKGSSFGRDGEKERHDFCMSQVSERVKTEDRTGRSDAVPFYMDRVTFVGHSGLYFIADGDTVLLEKALRLLSLEGIGTDRNVGNGYFEYVKAELALDLPVKADHVVALSSFLPESEKQLEVMLSSDLSVYELQRRGGWITTHPNQSLRKNVVYMLSAGSVLRHEAEGLCALGNIVDLRPKDLPDVEHPIWRSGKALFLPIKL